LCHGWQSKNHPQNLAKPYGLPIPAFFPEKNNCSTFCRSFQWVCGAFLPVFCAAVQRAAQRTRKRPRARRWAARSEAVMSNQPTRPDKTPDLCDEAFGFDVGTSPHGLSADLPLSHQETLEAASCPFSAKPVLPLLDEDSEAQVFEDQEAISGLLDGGCHE
jgi:hypothetical protein